MNIKWGSAQIVSSVWAKKPRTWTISSMSYSLLFHVNFYVNTFLLKHIHIYLHVHCFGNFLSRATISNLFGHQGLVSCKAVFPWTQGRSGAGWFQDDSSAIKFLLLQESNAPTNLIGRSSGSNVSNGECPLIEMKLCLLACHLPPAVRGLFPNSPWTKYQFMAPGLRIPWSKIIELNS